MKIVAHVIVAESSHSRRTTRRRIRSGGCVDRRWDSAEHDRHQITTPTPNSSFFLSRSAPFTADASQTVNNEWHTLETRARHGMLWKTNLVRR